MAEKKRRASRESGSEPVVQPIKIFYWRVNARATLTLLVCEWAQLPYQLIDIGPPGEHHWPGSLQAQTPFGQLPYMIHGDIKLAQSMAIARYAARKAHLQGDADAEYALSEMLIEEATDIYTAIAKGHYAPDKKEQYAKLAETVLPTHLAHLEKLLPDGAKQFGPKLVLVGDLAIFVALGYILPWAPKVLEKFPKLAKFHESIANSEGGKRFQALKLPEYFGPNTGSD